MTHINNFRPLTPRILQTQNPNIAEPILKSKPYKPPIQLQQGTPPGDAPKGKKIFGIF